MSEFRRPFGVEGIHDTPEEKYREGYQHGALAVLKAMRGATPPSFEGLKLWIDIDLQQWRYGRDADPLPPLIPDFEN